MTTVDLGTVARIERIGVDPSTLVSETVYVGLEHIERGGRIIGHATVASAELASTKFRFTAAHVLYGKLRPNLGKISRPTFDGICSTDILPIRPGNGLDRSYLAHYLAQPSMVAFAAARTSGANLPRLSPSVLSKFPVPLPPLSEQRRIAAILDHADALRAKRRQVLAHLDTLSQSIFYEMFGAPMDVGRWPMQHLGELARIIRGASPRPAGDPRYFGGDIPWLKISDLTAEAGATVSQIKQGVTEAGRDRSVLLPPRTLVLTNSATVGLPKIIGPATCIHDGFLAFLDLHPRVNQDWLYSALASSRDRLVALAPEGTQKNLNGPIVRRVEIAIPPVSLQNAYVGRTASVESERCAVQRALAAGDDLFASLQARVFRGEL